MQKNINQSENQISQETVLADKYTNEPLLVKEIENEIENRIQNEVDMDSNDSFENFLSDAFNTTKK